MRHSALVKLIVPCLASVVFEELDEVIDRRKVGTFLSKDSLGLTVVLLPEKPRNPFEPVSTAEQVARINGGRT